MSKQAWSLCSSSIYVYGVQSTVVLISSCCTPIGWLGDIGKSNSNIVRCEACKIPNPVQYYKC